MPSWQLISRSFLLRPVPSGSQICKRRQTNNQTKSWFYLVFQSRVSWFCQLFYSRVLWFYFTLVFHGSIWYFIHVFRGSILLTCFMVLSGILSGTLSRSFTAVMWSNDSRPFGMFARGTHVGGYQGNGCCIPFFKPCASVSSAFTLGEKYKHVRVHGRLSTCWGTYSKPAFWVGRYIMTYLLKAHVPRGQVCRGILT